MSCEAFKPRVIGATGAIRITKAAPNTRLDSDIRTRAVEPQSLVSTK